MNKNITAMVYTYNEEHRLPYVYENLKNFCDVIVYDGGSTDGTLDYCKNNNIKYVMRPKLDDGGFLGVNTYAWALKHAPTEYILHVICSHFYPKELLKRFAEVANENMLDAVYHDVIMYRYGVVVHRPLVRRISSACVFYKKSIVTFENSKIHDELAIQFDANKMVRLDAKDKLSLHLFQDDDCHIFTAKNLKYAAVEAGQYFNAGQSVGFYGIIFKPLFRFLYRYFRSGAFVLGVPGLIHSVSNLMYDFNVRIILWELCNDLDLKGVIRDNDLVRSKLIKNENDLKAK
jgi:glycosyltransferase involved in cell wall biosynthesis